MRDNWRRFITGGFELKDFTPDLYQYMLAQETDPGLAGMSHDAFWRFYFASDVGRLRRFLARYGDPVAAGDSTDHLLRSDLALLKEPVVQTLDALSRELYQAEKWQVLSSVGSVLNANPHKLIHWSQRYDDHYPFAESAGFLGVTPRVRHFIRQAVRNAFPDAPVYTREPVMFQPTIFTVTPQLPAAEINFFTDDPAGRAIRLSAGSETQPRRLSDEQQEYLAIKLGQRQPQTG